MVDFFIVKIVHRNQFACIIEPYTFILVVHSVVLKSHSEALSQAETANG